MVDVRKNTIAIEAINAILSNDGIAEVKIEKGGIAVVEIKRTLKTPKLNKGMAR